MLTREEVAFTQPELIVYFPASISADIVDGIDLAFKNSSTPPPDDPEVRRYTPPSVPLDQLPTFQLTVEYEVLDPTAGAVFYGDPAEPTGVIDPVYMLTESRIGMPRFWMPCLDTMAWCDRYLFDLDIAVKSDSIVIASGDLVETVTYPASEVSDAENPKPINLYKYQMHSPAHASEIILAVGPFVAVSDPVLGNTVTHFCLPGRAKELVHTCPPLFAKALGFCRDYFGSDPPTSSFKNVFVGSMGSRADTTVTGAGGIVVYSGDLLHSDRAIDECIVAREAIISGMVMSYFGRFLRPRVSEDNWLIMGLASHVSALGLQAILGRNWYRFHIQDLMKKLTRERSYDLSNVKCDRITDQVLDAVKRRSHIIVYMVEKRIGSDIMKRALRDIVAESRSVTIAIVKVLLLALNKPLVASDDGADEIVSKRNPYPPRVLKDLDGNDPEQVGSSVVTTGFDDAVHGIGVGPFLKRLRAISGTDVRSLVRLWAASSGIPRMQIAYSYNPRKHSLDFAVKQEGLGNMRDYHGGKGLLFSGALHVKVLEMEGTYEHTVEIREQSCVAEIPCHSRRAKHKSGAQAEKEFNENPARASPVIWLRVDPDNELCMDIHFKQEEDAWTAQLKGERDAVAQFDSCYGLSSFRSEGAAKSLLAVLADEQLYWRVRAEAANGLAACEGGLDMLLTYFRSCYTDGGGKTMGLVRPNSFSNLANYYVKRAMIRAICGVRAKGSRTLHRPEGSVAVKAAKFLSHMLSTNDNTGNEYDDDHYVVDLVKTCGKVGALCVGDSRHGNLGAGGHSTTHSITQQLQRYRSIEQLMPGQSGLVATAVAEALCDIEVAEMAYQHKMDARVLSTAIMSGRFSANHGILSSIEELSGRRNSEDIRLAIMNCLAKAYGGNLDFASWLLGQCFRDSSGVDVLDEYWNLGKGKRSSRDWGYMEAPTFRYRVLDALTAAASSAVWKAESSPLLIAVRRHTKRAEEFCLQIMKLIVGDPHPRVRYSALRFAKNAWGYGVPVCLLGRVEYAEAKRQRAHTPAVDIVPLKTAGSPVKIAIPQGLAAVKVSKPLKSAKASKNGKSSKGSKRKSLQLNSTFQRSSLSRSGTPIDLTKDENRGYRETKTKASRYGAGAMSPDSERPRSVIPPFGIPASVPTGQGKNASKQSKAASSSARHGIPKGSRESKVTAIAIPKSVPKSIPKSAPRPRSILQSVPKSVPLSIPKSVPRSAPKPIPKSEPRPSSSSSIPRSRVKSVPRSVPKATFSVPKSAPAPRTNSRFPFSWHPLDKEDVSLLKRAAELDESGSRKRARMSDEYVRSTQASDERSHERNSVESIPGDKNAVFTAAHDVSPHLPSSADGEKKKKKKKRKKRHLENGEDGHRKRKKKKKHHRDEEGRRSEGNPAFRSAIPESNGGPHIGGGASSSGQRRIGVVKIKVPPKHSVE